MGKAFTSYLVEGVLIATMVAGGVILYTYFMKELPSQPVVDSSDRDKKILDHFEARKTVEEIDLYGAMIRLSQERDKQALDVASELIKSPNLIHRKGVAQSLVYFAEEPRAIELIEKLLEDADESVRLQALKAMNQYKNARFLPALEKHLLKNFSVEEKIYSLAILYELRQKPEDREETLIQLLTLAKGGGPAASLAQEQVMEAAPHQKEVQRLMLQALRGSENEILVVKSLRELVKAQSPDVGGHLHRLSTHGSPKVRKAVLQSLHRACSENVWEIWQGIVAREKDETVLNLAFRELLKLQGQQAKTLIDQQIENFQDNPRLTTVARKVQVHLSKSTAQQSVCDG